MESGVSFSQAVYGYSLAAQVRLADETWESYSRIYKRFGIFLKDDPPLDHITVDDVRTFLAGMKVAPKTILNYHIALSSLWRWEWKKG